MEKKAIHYDDIRENNKRLIRNLVRRNTVSTKRELETVSGLTFPTVGAALKELMENGEVLERPGNSNGGRPGAVYRLNPEYAKIGCVSLKKFHLIAKVYDYCGTLVEERVEEIDSAMDEKRILLYLKKLSENFTNIKVVVMGIPGVSVNGVIKHLPFLPELQEKDLAGQVMEQLGIKLLVENDINMIAMGEITQYQNFAHILWYKECIGSACVLEGKLLRGYHGCAGEIELICKEKNKEESLLQAVLGITGVIDVPRIAISGEVVTYKDIENIQIELSKRLPDFRIPEIIYVEGEDKLYDRGLWEAALNCFN